MSSHAATAATAGGSALCRRTPTRTPTPIRTRTGMAIPATTTPSRQSRPPPTLRPPVLRRREGDRVLPIPDRPGPPPRRRRGPAHRLEGGRLVRFAPEGRPAPPPDLARRGRLLRPVHADCRPPRVDERGRFRAAQADPRPVGVRPL